MRLRDPCPQTRFVLDKALNKGLAPIVVVNKVDRPAADPSRVVDAVFDLFVDLGASEQQLDFPVVYASGLLGAAGWDQSVLGGEKADVVPLLQAVVDYVPAPDVEAGQPLRMLISNLEYDDYVGRIALGRLKSGQLKTGGQEILLTHSAKTSVKRAKVAQVYSFEGLEMVSATSVSAGGDIAAFSGVEEIEIGGETVNEADHPPSPARDSC